jgi:hypothetical protein
MEQQSILGEAAVWDRTAEPGILDLIILKRTLEASDLPKVAHSAAFYPETSSSQHFELARFWLQECRLKHPHCAQNATSIMPSRLLFIGDLESTGGLRLIETEGQQKQHSCLSHCWGGARNVLQLTSLNQERLGQKITLHQLPQSFQDAVLISRALALEYIWIDCLCIMQDNPLDWAQESAKMGSIFQNGVVTIAGDCSRSPYEGLFSSRDPLISTDCRLTETAKSSVYVVAESSDRLEYWDRSALTLRGWCYQEYLLSPRILRFGDLGIRWHCVMGEAQEDDYYGQDAGTSIRTGDINDEEMYPDRSLCMQAPCSQGTPSRYLFGPSINYLNLNPDQIKFRRSRGRGALWMLQRFPWADLVDPSYYVLHRL